MGTVYVPSRTLCLISGVANGDICFLDRKRLEPKALLWQHHSGCHFVSFVMHSCGAKFQEHCLNISRDIVYSVFYNNIFSCKQHDVITDLICIIEKRQYL